MRHAYAFDKRTPGPNVGSLWVSFRWYPLRRMVVTDGAMSHCGRRRN
jgi:hypothetical protein